MTQILETQPERTDLPLTVMPCVVADMIEPFKANFEVLRDVTRLRMYTDTTLDPDEIVRRCEGADAVIVIGVHIDDNLYTRLTHTQGHAKCFAFGGTGVASYIDLARARQDGVRVCNVRRYGDAAVAELAIALMMELARHVGELDTQVREGSWHGVFGTELAGKTLGLVGFGGIGQHVARIANGFGMRIQVWNSHVHADALAANPEIALVDGIDDLMATSDIVSLHLPLTDETRGGITFENLNHLRPGSMLINTARRDHRAGRARTALGTRRPAGRSRRVRQGAVAAGFPTPFGSRRRAHPACRLAGRWRLCQPDPTGDGGDRLVLRGRRFQRGRLAGGSVVLHTQK